MNVKSEIYYLDTLEGSKFGQIFEYVCMCK